MGIFDIIFLGILQGITEWFPVSSSGHLVIAQSLMGISPSLSTSIFLHTGTLLSVIVFFRAQLLDMFKELIRMDFGSVYGRLIPLILVGTLPVSVVGIVLYNMVSTAFSSMFFVGVSMVITGVILFATKYTSADDIDIDGSDAIIVGLAQALSIFPGISRSGFTISTSLFRGIEKERAFEFSFLLAIPALLGASLIELYKNFDALLFSPEILVGSFVSFVVGYLSLKMLENVLYNRKFHMFAYYCIPVGILVLVNSLM